MTIWFVAAAVVLIVELFIGTVYLLVVSVALAAAGIMYGLSGHFSAAVLPQPSSAHSVSGWYTAV